MNPALRFKVGIIIEPSDNAICDPSGRRERGTAALSRTIVVVVYKQQLTLVQILHVLTAIIRFGI